MKRRLSIKQLRRIFNIGVGMLLLGFLIVAGSLYARFANAMSPDPRVDDTRTLLTSFRSQDFASALERLEKRRDLPDPDPSLRNPFGRVPSR